MDTKDFIAGLCTGIVSSVVAFNAVTLTPKEEMLTGAIAVLIFSVLVLIQIRTE